jgi:hypothetical protein
MLLALTVEKLPFGWNVFKMCVKVLRFLNFPVPMLCTGDHRFCPILRINRQAKIPEAAETHPLRGYKSR